MADRWRVVCLLACCVMAGPSGRILAGAHAPLIESLRAVGPGGAGNVEAGQALRQLYEQPPRILPDLLGAFDGAGPIAINYLRGAFEAIADRAMADGEPLPAKELEAFIRDRRGHPRARRLAYEWLVKVDRSAEKRLIPGMLDDPSSELRREAVQRLIDEAKTLLAAKREDEARQAFRKALGGAADDDQVQAIVGPLRKLGDEIDLQKHFGFVTRWKIIGPFDNRDRKGFAAVYGPETRLDLTAGYEGKEGPVDWVEVTTDDEYGKIDVARQIAPYKGAVMYAVAEFDSARDQPVEFRLGTPNAWKLWVNGELLFAREEYHRGMKLDQYRVPGRLKPGRNVVLFKICQNEQDEDWAQAYEFQLRICDASGAAVHPRSDRNRSPRGGTDAPTSATGADE